jgi:hypothetical protein
MSLSVSLDKTHVAPGTTVTMTVVSDKRITTTSFPVGAGGETAEVTFSVQTGVTFGAGAPTTTAVSDDGHTAVYTFTT